MIVYCDTSFLLSLFREEDANHKEANELASRFDGEEFVLCEAHQIEFPAATRAAAYSCLAKGMSAMASNISEQPRGDPGSVMIKV